MNRNYVVLVDSTSDLKLETRRKYDIDYVAMNYVVDDKEYPASLDWVSHSSSDYYNMMRDGKIIKTTQVPGPVYEEKFEKIASEGKDVVYISCSSALSGSINTAMAVADKIMEAHPEMKICCVDSLISSLGQGLMAIKASQLRAQGKTVEETAKYIEDNRLKVHQCGTVGNLEFLRRAGRVTASSAFFGNMFGIKPILISDTKGQNLAVKKVRGARQAKIEIASDVAANVIDPDSQVLYISHADCLEDAEQLRDEILKNVKFRECYINTIAPIVGASVGPGTIIAFYVGTEVTEGIEG